MAEVDYTTFASRIDELARRAHHGDGGGGKDGMGSDLEPRVRLVEQAVVRIDETLKHLATKHDVSESTNTMIKWMVGIVFAGAGLVIAGLKLL